MVHKFRDRKNTALTAGIVVVSYGQGTHISEKKKSNGKLHWKKADQIVRRRRMTAEKWRKMGQ